ncbi:cysteine synthase A [Parasutterella muris]|uniref:Cysteine synthase n=1 Tax=Parasutterella muris TaxID=2565572 RepID=A0A6L6YLJ7_9BURK|nr:cysteine synthase A [Parasutterella muris]MVX57862.1 cysteine synthase A [Parasutterella muris]
MIYQSVSELIGGTPLVQLNRFSANRGLGANLLAKLEYVNPAGSVKDRVAFAMLDTADAEGKVKKNTVIIEPTSGNTGIGLAAAAASRGMKIILTMPETMSIERRKLLQAYGAEIVLTDGKQGMKGAIAKAEELAKENPNSFIPSQFSNPVNPQAHFKTTGPEIWADTEGKVDIFVAGVGTGGTISGVGSFLKSKNPAVRIVGVEPDTSAVISGKAAGPHKIQGIGAGFIPKNLDTEILDEVMPISAEAAYEAARGIAREEGFLVGISSGAALAAGIELAKRLENKGKNIVVLLPDTGDRYLSTELFA